MLRWFARPEVCLFCYHFNSNVDGATSLSAFAGVVFGAMLTAPMSVGCLANEKIIARPKENTVRLKKAKKTTVKQKIVVDTA
jgi:hypothetical protein